MVDWGVKSNVIDHGLKTKIEAAIPGYDGAGGLHHYRHIFKDKSDFERTTTNENGTTETKKLSQPFPMKNYSIYKSWLKSNKIKMLFMHVTAICPRDDVSEGQIIHDLEWTDNKLAYGSFDSRRNEVIKDVENGKLNIVVSGHSHRNVIMKVHNEHPNKVNVLGSGEGFGSVEQTPENLIMVTSSGGPLPKYYPGGPLICACSDEYEKGWDYKNKIIGKGELYRYKGKSKKLTPTTDCKKCGMAASDMVQKKA